MLAGPLKAIVYQQPVKIVFKYDTAFRDHRLF
jgi:hypothetical protein